MSKSIHAVVALAFGGACLLAAAAAHSEDVDRALLSMFCDAASIERATCKKASNYPGGRACDVTLSKERYSGKFLAAGTSLLVISYESGCEAHATDFGGSVVFEPTGGGYAFKGYQPGYRVNECIVTAGNAEQDRLPERLSPPERGVRQTGAR